MEGFTYPYDPSKLNCNLLVGDLLPYNLADIVRLPDGALSPLARLLKLQCNPVLRHIFPSYADPAFREPGSVRRLLWIMGITSPDHVPTNPKAEPIPFGSILTRWDSKFAVQHQSLSDDIYLATPRDHLNNSFGGRVPDPHETRELTCCLSETGISCVGRRYCGHQPAHAARVVSSPTRIREVETCWQGTMLKPGKGTAWPQLFFCHHLP